MSNKNDKKNKPKETTPYTEKKPDEKYVEHDVTEDGYKSPYVTKTDEEPEGEDEFRSPYTTPIGEEVEDEEFKSPYTTPEKSSPKDES